MSLRDKLRGLLVKIESVYGTDPTPTGAANAILVSNLEVSPMEGKGVDRQLIYPHFGNSESLPGAVNMKATFGVEIAGAGAAGTVPAYGALLRACAFSETINAGVSVVYAPVSAALESVTIYAYVDGVLHEGNGCRGTVSFDFNEGAIPVMKFDMTGIFVPIVDAALPTEVLTAFKTPVVVNRTNTPTIALHGYSAVMEKLSINMANAITYRSLPGGTENVQLTDRKPTGSISIEATTVAQKDWWTTIRNATTGALQLVHGTVAGNIVQVDAPKVQINSPKYANKDGIVMLSASLALVPNAGNDEITLTVK